MNQLDKKKRTAHYTYSIDVGQTARWIAVLSLLLATIYVTLDLEASTTAQDKPSSQAVDSWTEINDLDWCLNHPEEAVNAPECKDYLESANTGAAGPSGSATPGEIPLSKLFLCGETGSETNPDCACINNNIDTICRYRICGFMPGYYSQPAVTELAGEIVTKLGSVDVSSVFAVSFVGFADGTLWPQGSVPKPAAVPEESQICLLDALEEHGYSLEILDRQDRLDAQTALLRGCTVEAAIRDQLATSIAGQFEFVERPRYSFEKRSLETSDSRLRGAEVKVVIANSCKEILYE